jgi:hypothetical protein
MYLADKSEVGSNILFGWGILGMGAIFLLLWLFFSIIGIKNE